MIKPVNKTVIVSPLVQQAKTSHGLTITAENNQNALQHGEVMDVVPNYFDTHGNNMNTPFTKGDIVLYNKQFANNFYDNGTHYHAINVDDVIAIDQSVKDGE